ncbi:MAG: carboxymuconolactone decarboxylase family protein, partial [Streptomycetaceae bacterium]|nr:carboxymuconolactone decarboxylase family protein [Streptomycetaceae bacterium]
MEIKWQDAELLELVSGYTAEDADGTETSVLKNVRIAVQGGYLHIAHRGGDRIQIVSAPGVRRVVYP